MNPHKSTGEREPYHSGRMPTINSNTASAKAEANTKINKAINKMCKFLSAIVFRNGNIITAPEYTDSHSDLIAAYYLKDDDLFIRDWIRIEYTSEELHEPETYVLSVDEFAVPGWFDDELREKTTRILSGIIERMIVTGKREMLLGGCWILKGNAKVDVAKSATIKVICDSARIDSVCDSSSIDYVCDSARIDSVCDSSRIDYVCDSARIGSVRDSARIGSVCDSARIDYVCGSSRIDYVRDSSRIDYVCDSARIGSVRDSARIGSVCDSARIGYVRDSASIESDTRPKT